jgi:2-amino-4-hydroxy-6-hydroxymethyldihydropteridine diphosphokinase
MTDTIFVTGVVIHARHGILPYEEEVGQRFVIDLELSVDLVASSWPKDLPMADVLIALGGNVGDVRTTFQKAIANICGMTQAALLARSSDYATPPWGDEQQDRFINACIDIETSLDPHALLFTLHKIEKKFGRDRARERHWGPRTLDLDLIAYDDVSIDKPELTLPHPRLFERAFVLVPLAEIAPQRLIAGRTVAAALAELSTAGIERLPDLG